MIWVFRIVIYYLIVWVLTWIGIKMDSLKKKSYGSYNNYIIEDLNNGHIWWLIFPPVNIIAAIILFFRGLSRALSVININQVMTKFFFGKEKE